MLAFVTLQNLALKECTRQRDSLRQENLRLRGIINAFPSTATELQDRVTMLESLLAQEPQE